MLKYIVDNISKSRITKRDAFELLYLIYGNTSSDELKKEVAIYIKSYRMAKKFKELLGEDGRKEFEKF